MPGKAKWTIGKPTSSVAADGTASVAVPLVDGGKQQGSLTFTLTADRVLEVVWQTTPGATGLADFRAWSKGA